MKHFFILALLLLPVVVRAQGTQATNPEYILRYALATRELRHESTVGIVNTMERAGLTVGYYSLEAGAIVAQLDAEERGVFLPVVFRVTVVSDTARIVVYCKPSPDGGQLHPLNRALVEPLITAIQKEVGKP